MKIMAMNNFEGTSCRLCLKNITDKAFQVIDSVTRDILDGLLLKFKFHGNSQDVICNSCRGKLKATLEFKSTCLNTNNTIIQHMDCEKMLQVDLREVYIKDNRSRHVTSISYDDKICRLCMKVIKCGIRRIGEEEVEAIQKFIPEMNMMAIKDPIVCTPCFNSLCAHNTFLNDCLKVEQKIGCSFETSAAEIKTDASQSYPFIKNEEVIKGVEINDKQIEIKSECIDIKSEENESDTPFWTFKEEPVEYTTECQPEYVETISNSTLKDEDIQHEIKNENCELKYRQTFDGHSYKHDSCDYETDEQQRSHEDIPKEHKCNFCDYKSIYKANVNKHQLRHEDIPQEQMYKCESCDYKTIYKHCLMQHKLKHTDNPEKQLYKCESCDYKTNYKYSLIRHKLKHTNFLEALNKNDQENPTRQPSHKGIPKEHKCNFCDYKSIYKANVNKHQLRHKDIPQDRMYKCESCDYKTIYKHCLIQHKLKHTENPEKQLYKCDSCDYRTNYKQRLAQHQLIKHKDVLEEQMFNCDSCDYKTICKTNLNKHQLRHKDIPEDQMYKCDICDYKTVYKPSLKKHQLRHKNIPEEQMFKCDLCDYKTIYKSNLNKHQLKHKVEKQI